MLNFIDNFKIRLTRPLRAGDTSIRVNAHDARKLNAVGANNHVYLTIDDGVRYEVVRYDHGTNFGAGNSPVDVPVQRDVNGTGTMNFPVSTCVVMDWNKTQLREFICQTASEC